MLAQITKTKEKHNLNESNGIAINHILTIFKNIKKHKVI